MQAKTAYRRVLLTMRSHRRGPLFPPPNPLSARCRCCLRGALPSPLSADMVRAAPWLRLMRLPSRHPQHFRDYWPVFVFLFKSEAAHHCLPMRLSDWRMNEGGEVSTMCTVRAKAHHRYKLSQHEETLSATQQLPYIADMDKTRSGETIPFIISYSLDPNSHYPSQ
jgi:hypothetical protein